MKKLIFLLGILLLVGACNFFPEEEINYMVEVRADSGVTVSPLSATLNPGEKITFAYTLKEGYMLNAIMINGVAITPTSNTFSVVANVPNQSIFVTTTEEEKQEFIISANAKPNGTISPSGEVKVIEGKDQKFSIVANAGFLIDSLRIDGQEIVPSVSSYTFSNVSSNKKIEATFKKDSLLWPLLNIEWSRDSVYIDDYKDYGPGEEILNFYSNNKYTVFWNNKLYNRTGWAVDKSQNPALINYEGISCQIEEINEQKLIFSYMNGFNQKVTHVYSAKSKYK